MINTEIFNTATAEIWCDELYYGYIGFFDDKHHKLSVVMEEDMINIYVDDDKYEQLFKVSVTTGKEAREFLGERISKMIDDCIKKIDDCIKK